MAVKGKKAAANTAKTKATVKKQQCYKVAAKTKATAKNQNAAKVAAPAKNQQCYKATASFAMTMKVMKAAKVAAPAKRMTATTKHASKTAECTGAMLRRIARAARSAMASTATAVCIASAEETMTVTTETTTAECINSTVGTAQETTETMKATESMSATAEIMPSLRRCNAGIDESPDDVATRISMKAAAMTDSDYSSADTMELPPKNADVMQATAEEKAWAAMGEDYRAWAKNVDEENEQVDEEEKEERELVRTWWDEGALKCRRCGSLFVPGIGSYSEPMGGTKLGHCEGGLCWVCVDVLALRRKTKFKKGWWTQGMVDRMQQEEDELDKMEEEKEKAEKLQQEKEKEEKLQQEEEEKEKEEKLQQEEEEAEE